MKECSKKSNNVLGITLKAQTNMYVNTRENKLYRYPQVYAVQSDIRNQEVINNNSKI
jgi:hypothetical protein